MPTDIGWPGPFPVRSCKWGLTAWDRHGTYFTFHVEIINYYFLQKETYLIWSHFFWFWLWVSFPSGLCGKSEYRSQTFSSFLITYSLSSPWELLCSSCQVLLLLLMSRYEIYGQETFSSDAKGLSQQAHGIPPGLLWRQPSSPAATRRHWTTPTNNLNNTI